MKNKNKLAFLSVAFAALLALGACNLGGPSRRTKSSENSPSSTEVAGSSDVDKSSSASSSSINVTSSTPTTSSTVPVTTHAVTFVVEGVTVSTMQIEDGQVAVYQGETPTKQSSDGKDYVFKCWSPDINTPITKDTTFTAVFSSYSNVQMIDDFESYEDSPSMKDEGWTALGYSNSTNTWTDQTGATVSLGSKSVEGNKALRFDAWENGVGYKFAKIFQGGEFPDAANALQFRLMVPQINTVKVLLHAKMTIAGSVQSPAFHYTLNVQSGDYVEYTIPLNDEGWALWGESGKSIAWAADWLGVNEDLVLNYLTRIEFYVQGNDGGSGLPYVAFLDSAKFVTIDNPTNKQEENLALAERYTATLSDGSTLRLDVDNNGTATASIIDLETPVSVNGTIAVEGRNVTFTSSALTYVGTLSNSGNLIKFVSASGTMASLVDDVNLVGVQVVDNFEQYTEDGTAYYQNSGINQRSGCRGAFYSEYYNENATSSTSPWGGNKWSLMGGNGDQLKLKQNQSDAHSGKNYLCLKNSQSNGMRYMQWGLFDGSAEKNAYRGSKMGFWAKTNGVVKSFIAYMYSQSAPTNATRDNYVKKITFTETAAISDWKHYEVELNPNVVYYGFMFFLNANWSADSYLYIDDVEIYGANPYATYVAPEPEKPAELKAGISYIAKINGLAKATIEVQKDNKAVLSAPGANMIVNGTFAINEKEVTFTFGDVTYVVTSEENNSKLTFKSVNGSDSIAQALNNVSFEQSSIADDAESYESAGTMYYQGNTSEAAMSGARGAYYCDYYTGSGTSPIGGSGWNLMGGSGDQLTLDTEVFHSGKQSLKMKKSTAGAMRYLQWDLYKGTARAIKNVNKFVVYLKNNATNDTKVKLCVFNQQQITPSNQTTARVMQEITLPASQDWTAYTIDLDINATYYGYGLILETASAVGWVNVDDACFIGPDVDPTLNYYAKKDLTLNGVLASNPASIKFNGNGEAVLNAEALGVNNVSCTYTMAMNDGNQVMTLVAGDNTIVGTYEVTLTGVASFVVTSATGSLAAAVTAGTTFSNQ